MVVWSPAWLPESSTPWSRRPSGPSTGNYCRGGAFDSSLLGCSAVAILPEGMSRERFQWLKAIGAEVIATPGTESNVKEIYDKCWEIRRTRPECVIFNQFDEFGNALWHYEVTGPAMDEVLRDLKRVPPCRFCFRHGLCGHHCCRRLPPHPPPPCKSGCCRVTPVSHAPFQRFRRTPHRGDRRQACSLDPQRPQHRHDLRRG